MVQNQTLKGIPIWWSENKRRLIAIALQIIILLALLGAGLIHR